MSGHSKCHNIQKTKGAADAKRSQIFTKIAREMIVAVKTGGSGDPNNNSRLATVIAKAKAANMPNDNIKRTIDKALGSGNADSYENVVYEGYGPSGVAVIVDALTDNRNRTAPEVRHLLDKYGKGLGATGCVSWSFDRKGVIIIEKEDLDEDTVMMDALDAGADDYLVKPFGVAELRAKVAASLRRERRVRRSVLDLGRARFDLGARELSVTAPDGSTGAPVPLTSTEYGICEFLAKHPGRAYSRSQIREAVRGWESETDDAAVSVHVGKARAKLRAAGVDPIATVWGVGYKWEAGR